MGTFVEIAINMAVIANDEGRRIPAMALYREAESLARLDQFTTCTNQA